MDQVRDNLRGAVQVQPVLQQTPGAMPSGFRAPQSTDFAYGMFQQVSKYVSGKISEAVNTQQERSLMDGQLAHQQGKTFEEVQTGGDKWALEGYRMIDAQSIASSLLIAQQEEIQNGAYADDPDAYRQKLMGRFDSAMAGVSDKRTGDLVKDIFVRQSATLIDQHTKANIEYKEQKAFESVENGIDTISRDPTATQSLINFSKGLPGSGSEGLNPDRRKAAVAAGVVKAFANDNPLAYAALSKEGALADMTTDQINAVRSAKESFESRRRSEYDEQMFNDEQALMTSVENGELSPTEAVTQYSALLADYHIDMKADEAGAMYRSAQAGVRTATMTRGVLMDEAAARGDVDAQANIMFDALTGSESSGNPRASYTDRQGRQFGGLIQMGQERLNEYTQANGIPYMSVETYRNLSASEQRRVGKWHLKNLLEYANNKYHDRIGTKIHGVTVTLSGMVAAAHLGGKGGLDALMNDDSVRADELGTTTLKYLSKYGGGAMTEMFTPQQRFEYASNMLDETRKRLALDAYERIQPQIDDLDESYKRGEISPNDWKEARQNLWQEYGQAKTKADVDREIEVSRSASEYIRDTVQQQNDYAGNVALDDSTRQLEVVMKAAEKGEATEEQVQAALSDHLVRRQAIMSDYGLKFDGSEEAELLNRSVIRATEAISKGNDYKQEGVIIDNAINTGTLDKLTPAQQQRAISDQQTKVQQMAQQSVAQGTDAGQVATAASNQMMEFYAKSGVVDQNMRRAFNGILNMPFVDKEGNPSPQVVDAIENLKTLRDMSPTVADKYIDEDKRGIAYAILNRAAGGSIAEAVRSVGLNQKNSPLASDPSAFVQRPDVQKRIDKAVEHAIGPTGLGMLGNLLTGRTSIGDLDNLAPAMQELRGSDAERSIITNAIRDQVEDAIRIDPWLPVTDVVPQAAERVMRSGGFIGGDFVMMPRGASLGEQFFGARTDEIMGSDPEALNNAVVAWMESPEATTQYPYLQDSHYGGPRPFRTFIDPNSGAIMLNVEDSSGNYRDTIVLPADRAGQIYLTQRQKEAIQ